ncbi:unnamed protein product [marine sediment metagenome]|uniref:Uncharacterized protein n=1 Tax=marine sediment metagenome TaxID=412755 RepID=X0W3J1_9ZZZZ
MAAIPSGEELSTLCEPAGGTGAHFKDESEKMSEIKWLYPKS